MKPENKIGLIKFVISSVFVVVIAVVVISAKSGAGSVDRSNPTASALYDAEIALEGIYRWDIYGGAECDGTIIGEDAFLYCHGGDFEFGGLYRVEPGAGAKLYRLHAANGKAQQHAGKRPDIDAPRDSRMNDIPAIIEAIKAR